MPQRGNLLPAGCSAPDSSSQFQSFWACAKQISSAASMGFRLIWPDLWWQNMSIWTGKQERVKRLERHNQHINFIIIHSWKVRDQVWPKSNLCFLWPPEKVEWQGDQQSVLLSPPGPLSHACSCEGPPSSYQINWCWKCPHIFLQTEHTAHRMLFTLCILAPQWSNWKRLINRYFIHLQQKFAIDWSSEDGTTHKFAND